MQVTELDERERLWGQPRSNSLYAVFVQTVPRKDEHVAMTVPPNSVQVETGHQDMIVRPFSLPLHVKHTPVISRVDSSYCTA